MVDPVIRVSASSASISTQADSTLAIGSDAYNAWIAARQAQINHDLTELQKLATEELERRKAEEETDPEPRDAHARQYGEPLDDEPVETQAEDCTLSGESDRIGSVNFDDDTPFGHRTAIL